jgi:hypothetical protein
MAPRENCPETRELCTGPVMLHGTGMTLTYLCPQTSDAVSTVHVTVTATTIVTLAPDNTALAPTKLVTPFLA